MNRFLNYCFDVRPDVAQTLISNVFGDSWGGWVESASAKLAMGLWTVRSRDKVPVRISSIESHQDLGGGFKLFFYVHHYLGK